jgi:hypothetical protein
MNHRQTMLWVLLWAGALASSLLLAGVFPEAALAAAPLLAPFEVRRLEAFQPNALTGDQFGAAVAVSADGSTLVVGAHLADPGDVENAGVAYVFALPTWRTFSGVAQGGTVELTLSGITLVVPTSAGASAASVAAAVAAAINADPTLSDAGIVASANGSTLESNGELLTFLVDDPGLGSGGPFPVPSLGAPGASLAASLILAAAARQLGPRRHARA